MATRERYFISMNKETVTKVSVADTTEFEVLANLEEITYFKALLRDNEREDFWYMMRNVMLKPFNEKQPEKMRQREDDNIIKAYQFIHDYGTPETKEKLHEMGFH
ncbi:MAG TPA: hypothetical protein VFF20_00720 [Pseudogracilibacillus sp.]|nr:hypothetical protein [Pseudogracilibacillus sp.]